MSPITFRIGVDVGGTNTDAVLLRMDAASSPNRGVMASFKHPTTPNVSEGIESAVRAVLKETQVLPGLIESVMIGTTHFMNAVVEADSRHLSKVGVIRLGAPYTEECPPFLDFPADLRAVTEGHVAILKGGLQIDGNIINEIDEHELVVESVKLREKGVKAIAIVGIYSPLDKTDGTSQEERARTILARELGSSVQIVCSRDVGQIGLLERENATILNAAILRFAQKTVSGFQKAIRRLGLLCPLFLTQNDGTVTSAAAAARLPIRTFSSGATNSMRGAAYLAGVGGKHTASDGANIIVVDIGGTTTDIGVMLPSGFPRQAAAFIKIGGVRTNFSMPDVYSIGLGGGSRIHISGPEVGGVPMVSIGPDSTGYQLLVEGLVFGGSTLTVTDILVASNESLSIGDRNRVANGKVDPDVIQGAKKTIKKLLEDAIDRMKTTPAPATVLLVGGGGIIAPEELDGVGALIRPPFFSCANAVGACVANVAGEIDTIEVLQVQTLEDALERCKSEAAARAVKAGAKEETVNIVELETLPIQYVTNKATRLIVRAIGELDTASATEKSTVIETDEDEPTDECKNFIAAQRSGAFNLEQYSPFVNDKGEWLLSEVDLEWIAEGCGILGTGGGGSPYPAYIMARQILRDGGTIRVISHESLPDDAIIFRGIFMGSPSVSNERLQAGTEIMTACKNLARFLNIGTPAAVISDEIGGSNGIQPMILASARHLNVPVFDGDLMGRAYPNMWQSLPSAYKVPASLIPCAIADGVGNSVVLPSTSNRYMVETILRGICTELGSKAGVSMAPLSAAICRKYGVTKTVSQAWRLGRAVAVQRQKSDFNGIPAAILKIQNGKKLFTGKIIDVKREVRAGFTWGSIIIAPLLDEEQEEISYEFNSNDRLFITFQNENLTAERFSHVSPMALKTPVAVVPDLICVLDSQSGSSLGTHEYRYGLRVIVLALAGSPLWTTAEGLSSGGPESFGIDIPFKSVGVYKEPWSIIDEFRAKQTSQGK